MKRYFLAFALLLSILPLKAQIVNDKPKLVVGIVVDQMRYDYLTRFWDQFGEEGFKRMVNNGFNFKNNRSVSLTLCCLNSLPVRLHQSKFP